MRGSFAGFLLLSLALLAALALAPQLTEPPAVRAAAVGEFDVERAAARLERILDDPRPHPVDSDASDGVRQRLVAELRSIGLTPRITDDFVCNASRDGSGAACGRVRNIIATLGPAEGRHVLLVAHYDSTPIGPGAADDGIGVASMLETAALLSRQPLERPVTFLFNEGEESGLLGARAFMERDPLAASVDTILNFEARGVSGPALMFETSRPNGAAIALFEDAVAWPAANSLATDFYRLIPNSTDVAVLEERGDWTILNFAVIGNETRYHTPDDRLEALDRRSLQHMGDQALALTLRAANGPSPLAGGEMNYADLLGRSLLVIPTTWAFVGLALTFILVGITALRRHSRLLGAAGVILLALAAAAGGAFLLQTIIAALRPGHYWRAWPMLTDLAVHATALVAVAAMLALLGRRVGDEALRLAFWLLFILAAGAVSFLVPGAAIFFLLPAMVATLALLLRRWRVAERAGRWLAALVLFLLWAPLLALASVLLHQGSAWIFAPIAAILLLPWLIEARPLLGLARPAPIIAALAAVALVAWGAVLLAPAYSEDRKQQFGIEYAAEAGGAARWLVANDGAALPPAFSAFKPGAKVPWSSRARWEAPAPAGLAAAPAVEVLGTAPQPAGRIVRIRLRANGADAISLRAPRDAGLQGFTVYGWAQPLKVPPAGTDNQVIACRGRSCDGLVLELRLGSREPLPWTIIGSATGLSAEAEPLVAARPSTAAPQYNPDARIGVAKVRL
jgi:hypothetical protein